jgi:hypothetical protein
LRGDLDNILLKALQKGPLQRYSSADQFSEDVNRHLEGLPVGAREDTIWYRAGKFIHRHQVGLAASALIVTAVTLGLATTLWATQIALDALPAGAGAQSALAPEMMLFSVLLWIGLGAAVFFTRANLRRVLGALAAGLVFMLVVLAEESLPASMGLRHFSWTVTPPAGLIYAAIPYAAAFALLGWRFVRRFDWRGMLTLLLAAALGGPLRDYFWSLWMPGIATVPGLLPWIADGAMWLCGIGFGQAVMRLIAGPSKSDLLAPLRWKL